MNDAEIRLKVDIDGDKANSSLGKLSDVGAKVGKAIAAGTVVAGTALTALVGKSVAAAGELEQQIGGTEAVFGQFANKVQEDSKKAYSTAGLSANEYMGTINKMGSLMQGSGISQEKSMDLSAQAMQRAADVASIMGIDVGSAMESIAGAAKGNFTMMDNLGVAMNATTIESYALSKGIDTAYTEMDNATKIGLAMEMFLEKSTYAAGNYAKENETFAGSFSTLKASFENFLSGAGSVDDLIKSVVSFGKILITKIKEMAPQVVKGIVDLINAIIPMIPELLQELLPTVLDGVMMLVQGIIDALPVLITMLASMMPTILQSLIDGLIQIVNSLSEMLPTLIPTIIQAVLTLIPVLLNNLPLFLDAGIQLIIGLANGLIDAIPVLIEMLPEIISSLISGLMGALPQLILLGPTLLIGLAKGLISAIPSLVSITPKIFMGLVDGIKKGLGNFADVGTQLVKGLWSGISNVTKWLLDKIKGFGKSVMNGIKSIFGIHSPSTEFAWVGKMNIMGLEEGIEGESKNLDKTLDLSLGSSLDYVENIGLGKYNPAIGGGNANMSSPVYVNVEVQQDKFGNYTNTIKTFSNGSKNSYNYGAS